MPVDITGFLLALLMVTAAQGATVYVSPTGDDRNSGAEARPFATLARARDEIRHGPTKRPITVIIHGGTYRQTATLELDARDSASQWQAAAGQQVRIDGGVRIDPKMFEGVKDQEILQRLPDAARAHVVVADLSALGMESVRSWPIKFRSAPKHPSYSSTTNGCKLRLAQYHLGRHQQCLRPRRRPARW